MSERLYFEIIRGSVNHHLGLASWGTDISYYAHHVGVLCFTAAGRIVGSLECYVSGKGRGRTHTAAGTYVDGEYQGRGIATRLWKLALEHTKPVIVSVQVVSDRGKTLAKALEQKFPAYEWDIWEDTYSISSDDDRTRKLRHLRRKRKVGGYGPASRRKLYHPGY